MKNNKFLPRIKVCMASLLTSLLCIGAVENIFAEDTPILINNDLIKWSETVELSAEKIGQTGVDISYSTASSEENYNYGAISSMFDGAYGPTPIFSETYGGIALNVKNGDEPVYINIAFTDTQSNRLVMKQDGSVLISKTNENNVSLTEFGSIKLEADFQGKVIIPMNMFTEDKGNTAAFDYSKLASWTAGILIEGKKTSEIKINDLLWVSTEFVDGYEKSFDSYIDGRDTIQIPEHGESIEDYSIHSIKGNTYKFSNDGYENGIAFSEDGRIVLNTQAKEQTIVLSAVDDKGVVLHKEVKLVNSWRVGKDDFTFYGPEELESITYDFQEVTDKHINYARITILAGCGIVFAGYVIFYAIFKFDKRKEEE